MENLIENNEAKRREERNERVIEIQRMYMCFFFLVVHSEKMRLFYEKIM